MHIGGLHIFAGLFALALYIFVNIAYIYIALWLYKKLQFLIYRYNCWCFEKWLKSRKEWAYRWNEDNPEKLTDPEMLPKPKVKNWSSYSKKYKKFVYRGSSGKVLPEAEVKEYLYPEIPSAFKWNAKIPKYIVMLSVLIILIMYAGERFTYMRGDFKDYRAKEYWVVGEVIAKQKRAIGHFIKANNPIFIPYTFIQKNLYDIGKGYLYLEDNSSFTHHDDAEIYIWYSSWFIFPNTQLITVPFGTEPYSPSPKMVGELESLWMCLEKINELQTRDPKMYEKYLRDFPLYSTYYHLLDAFFLGKIHMNGDNLVVDPYYSERIIRLYEWAEDVIESWEETGVIEDIWKNHKHTAVIMQTIMFELIVDLNKVSVARGEFSCQSKETKLLYDAFVTGLSKDPKKNAYMNIRNEDKRFGERNYEDSVVGKYGRLGRVFVEDVCRMQLPENNHILMSKDSTRKNLLGYKSMVLGSYRNLENLMLYFLQTKDKENFCEYGLRYFGDNYLWRISKENREMTTAEIDYFDAIYDGVDEMCLPDIEYYFEDKLKYFNICGIFLDRYLKNTKLSTDDNSALEEQRLKVFWDECTSKRSVIEDFMQNHRVQ